MILRNFEDAHLALGRFYNKRAGRPYTLDKMRALMEYVGNPQNSLCILHVAGTSGKTSTSYYAAALLQSSGMTVGMTVSPHVDEVNERVQINLQPLPEAEFCNQLSQFLQLVDSSKISPSYFELMVAFAYWYFAKCKVDYAVVEVGLGGLLDGTNVINRKDKVCLITDIGLDHTEVLGDTLSQIAWQKAGIIQQGNHIFMHEQGLEITSVVQQTCRSKRAKLNILRKNTDSISNDLPAFQARNFILADTAVNYVLKRDGRPLLSEADKRQAIKTVIPARMERAKIGNRTVIIDGSHNAQKLANLASSIKAIYSNQQIVVLTAFVEGNDERWQAGIQIIMGLAEHIIITRFHSEQDVPKVSVDPSKIAKYCVQSGYESIDIIENPEEAYKALLRSIAPILLITGSFYLLNHIRPLIVKS